MPAAERARFAERVLRFTELKTFDGRDGFTVTPEVEVAIAASAVELTFGLDTWELSYFSRILVYPSDYKSPATGRYHKGETNLGGFVCLSWKAFQEGYADPHDKINLGLHEFAHALRFNGVKGDPCDDFFENYFARWLACAYSEFEKLRRQAGQSIFRKYGGVNINEFFSVAVETFFETPSAFKAASPALYRQTAILLNQAFSDEGEVILNCRKELMAEDEGHLSQAYPGAMAYTLWRIGRPLLPMIVCLLMGTMALLNGNYRSPLPYGLIAFGLCIWLYLEWAYTRVFFDKTSFVVQKGFLIGQPWRERRLPYSQLISFKRYAPGKGLLPGYARRTSIAYYAEGSFHKQWLYIEPLRPAFDGLCTELKQQGIFVLSQE